MRISFILPGPSHVPVGGPKVVYEYANKLAQLGNRVTIVHPAFPEAHVSLHERLLRLKYFIRSWANKSYQPTSWFNVDKQVRLILIPTLCPQYIPKADVIVATSWQTAERVGTYPHNRGKKYYLIQHLETWSGPEERVLNTWKSNLEKIVISKWLYQKALSLGESASYIPNGLDFKAFGIDILPERREPHTVMMLYHDSDWKGSDDGLKALRLAKCVIPDLKAILFGVPLKPGNLPPWVEYFQNATQTCIRKLYNEAAIFLAPSWSEGWPLPPAEALMSGAALVATDIGGHHEYAIHNRTALLSPPKDPEALADHIVRLCRDDELRRRLAYEGNKHIQEFTWDRAVNDFARVISS